MIETLVSEEDFLATYNGLEDRDDYEKATALYNAGETCREITKKTGRAEMTVRSWVIHGRRPSCMHGLEKAKKLEIIPLHKDSPKLPALNELCAWTFWTGCVGSNYEMMICEKQNVLEELKKYFKETLQLKAADLTGQEGIHFNHGSHCYGRVLYCMGSPKGRKSIGPVQIPRAITNNPDAHFRFLQIMFRTRKTAPKKRTSVLYLMENRNEQYAEAFGKEIIQLMNTALPKLSVTNEHLHNIKQKGKRYSPRIHLTKDLIGEIEKHYPELNAPGVLSPENSYCSTHNTSTFQQASQ